MLKQVSNPEGGAGTGIQRLPALMLWIIWGALFVSTFIYLVVLGFSGNEPREEASEDSLATILYVVGFTNFAIGQGLKFLVRRVKTPEGKPKIPAWIDQAFIAAIALSESSAIFGLILAFQGEPMSAYLPLFVITWVGLLLLAPALFYPKEETSRLRADS